MKNQKSTIHLQRGRMLMFQRTVMKIILICQSTPRSRQIMGRKTAKVTVRRRAARTGVN